MKVEKIVKVKNGCNFNVETIGKICKSKRVIIWRLSLQLFPHKRTDLEKYIGNVSIKEGFIRVKHTRAGLSRVILATNIL